MPCYQGKIRSGKQKYLKFWENTPLLGSERESGTNGGEGSTSRNQRRIERIGNKWK